METDSDISDSKATTFFRRICQQAPDTTAINVVMVSHIVDSAAPFLPVIAKYFTLRAVYAKRSSINDTILSKLKRDLPTTRFERLDRELFSKDPAFFISDCFPEPASEKSKDVILVDIGGYFAEAENGPDVIKKRLQNMGYRLLGIVEDTENGHKRYQDWLDSNKHDQNNVPIYSVARSPLKTPENHLVGVAVTFSIEALLREQNTVLQSRRAGVIGFGPIGRSVASSLRSRGVPVRVCEIDPIRLAVAAAQGFHVHHYDDDFISFVHDLNLIVSATGAGAKRSEQSNQNSEEEKDISNVVRPSRLQASRKLPLNVDTVHYLEQNTYVASVTSADDEIDVSSILTGYNPSHLSPYITQYTEKSSEGDIVTRRGEHKFMLMMNGNAVNFAHGGVIGPAIQLLQGEIAMCMQKLVSINHDMTFLDQDAIQELTDDERRLVADQWLDQYLVENLQQS